MLETKEIHQQEMEYWRDDVEKINEDSLHGSIYLAGRALDIVEQFVEKQLYRNRTELIQALSKLSNALVRAKPIMALIYNHTHQILQFIQDIPREQKNIDIIKQLTLEKIEVIRQKCKRNSETVTKWGARLILDHHVILTHSSSSLVETIMLHAKKQKRRFRLICTESRPLKEGAQMACRLALAGVKVRLIPDADIARAVQECNFILTGTDRFTETSFLNKTGTYAIAALSKQMNKPLYIAGESDKILMKRIYPVRFSPANSSELFEEGPVNNLQIENTYFEETPIEFADKIVLEDGIFELKEFMDRYL